MTREDKIVLNGEQYSFRNVDIPMGLLPAFQGSLVGGDDVPLLYGTLRVSANAKFENPVVLNVNRYADDLEKKEVMKITLKGVENRVVEKVFFDSIDIDSEFSRSQTSVHFTGHELVKINKGAKSSLLVNTL